MRIIDFDGNDVSTDKVILVSGLGKDLTYYDKGYNFPGTPYSYPWCKHHGAVNIPTINGGALQQNKRVENYGNMQQM